LILRIVYLEHYQYRITLNRGPAHNESQNQMFSNQFLTRGKTDTAHTTVQQCHKCDKTQID